VKHDRGKFHYRHAAFSSQLKSKCGNILGKDSTLRIMLNIDDGPVVSRSHTHPSHSEFESENSRLLTSSLSLGVPVPPQNPVYVSRVDPLDLPFSLF
jgi:hypothetical protein